MFHQLYALILHSHLDFSVISSGYSDGHPALPQSTLLTSSREFQNTRVVTLLIPCLNLQRPCTWDNVKCLQCGPTGSAWSSLDHSSIFICHIALHSDLKLDSLIIIWALTWLQISLCVTRVPASQPEEPWPGGPSQPGSCSLHTS